jgi:hypothetical protein
MQYLLTEAEYKGMQQANKSNVQELQTLIDKLCMRVALSESIPDPWDMHRKEGEPKEGPWGCIRSEDPEKNPMYCDECPVDGICEYPNKEYSQ